MKREVFKFGGASIATAENIRNVVSIIQQTNCQELIIVASALGKTTNALEEVVKAYFVNAETAIQLLTKIKTKHFEICKELFLDPQPILDKLNNIFIEGYWLLEEPPYDDFSYCYDQIVSIGELCSTTILAELFKKNNIPTKWIDARGIIKTTPNYQEGEILWELTEQSLQMQILPYIKDFVIVTQGFIGSTDENHTTTLGREGSDFTGAIIANLIDAESYTIWKDVPGVLNADPRIEKQTVLLKELTYREAVEMTYYGAKVIHPKTIKPVENKNIPLIVRSFKDLTQPGTVISKNAQMHFEKSVVIHLHNQTLLKFVTKDFSFFEEEQISEIMSAVKQNHINLNLLQREAIECSFLIDADKEAVNKLLNQLSNYNIEVNEGLTLITLRHYTNEEAIEYSKNKRIYIEQKTPITYQIIY